MLDVRDLRTYFLSGPNVARAVDGVSFTVLDGTRVGIVGESGSGKSVTALSIMRLIDPPAGRIVGGEVLFDGEDLLTLSEREMQSVRGRRIAMVFQDPMTALNPVFTVGDQLTESIRLHRHVGRREARTIAVEALASVQIPRPERRLDDYPHQFSGGMRQRLVIAIALSGDPRVLIADEPTTALDVTTQAQILDLLLRVTEERGTAVILITHDLGIVAGFCEHVYEMYAGRVVEHGTVDELFDRPLHPYTAGLIASVSRLDRPRSRRLQPIGGQPPSLARLPTGCPFHPRCAYAVDRCREEMPMPRLIASGHGALCHFAGELDLAGAEDGSSNEVGAG